jgi:hypothetical protein
VTSYVPHSMGANCLCSHAFPPRLVAESSRELQLTFDIAIASGGDDQRIGVGLLTVRAVIDLVSLSLPPSLLSAYRPPPLLLLLPPSLRPPCRQSFTWIRCRSIASVERAGRLSRGSDSFQ